MRKGNWIAAGFVALSLWSPVRSFSIPIVDPAIEVENFAESSRLAGWSESELEAFDQLDLRWRDASVGGDLSLALAGYTSPALEPSSGEFPALWSVVVIIAATLTTLVVVVYRRWRQVKHVRGRATWGAQPLDGNDPPGQIRGQPPPSA